MALVMGMQVSICSLRLGVRAPVGAEVALVHEQV